MPSHTNLLVTHTGWTDLLDQPWKNWFFGTVTVETVYKGAETMSVHYKGSRTEAQLYLGAKDLFP